MATAEFESPQFEGHLTPPELPKDRPYTLAEVLPYRDYQMALAIQGLERAARASRETGGVAIDSESIAKQITDSHAKTFNKLERRQNAA